jgi:hypothetical protein
MGVLLLMTIGLVVASGILLVLGFVLNVLSYIYVSILCAATAGILLMASARWTQRRVAIATGGHGAPAQVGGARRAGRPPRRETRSPSRPNLAAGQVQGEAAGRAGLDDAAVQDGLDEDLEDELDIGLEEGSDHGSDSREDYPVVDPEDSDEEWVEQPPEGESDESWGDDWGDEIVFPIADYDDLRVSEILPVLPELDPDELEEVRDRESAGRGRTTILDRIDELLDRKTARRPVAPAQTQPALRRRPTKSRDSGPDAVSDPAPRRAGASRGSTKGAAASSARAGSGQKAAGAPVPARARKAAADHRAAAGPEADVPRTRKAVPSGKALDPAPGPARQRPVTKAASTGKARSRGEATDARASATDDPGTRGAKPPAKPDATKRER